MSRACGPCFLDIIRVVDTHHTRPPPAPHPRHAHTHAAHMTTHMHTHTPTDTLHTHPTPTPTPTPHTRTHTHTHTHTCLFLYVATARFRALRACASVGSLHWRWRHPCSAKCPRAPGWCVFLCVGAAVWSPALHCSGLAAAAAGYRGRRGSSDGEAESCASPTLPVFVVC